MPLLGQIAFSQSIDIGAPTPQTSVQAGSSLVVEIDKPDSLTGSTDVSLIISIDSCQNAPCPTPVGQGMGTVLYNGPFNPQFDSTPTGKPPHQNFTLFIPATFPKGPAELIVFHKALVGVSQEPLTELKDVVLNIV
ncbi:hypothetical protein D9613_006157 [Agrocybe pediades]|uniref:Uncharacterized protein n=1 Tax=Agrocybe pediades TaxID=84607 RepID=A0A8H4VNQ6_9AGAR|nr:hypothetical protein D9613_006157 [Agrocybe pediades]